ncbi:VOC family protein [Nocardia sp. NBC_00403]|uniref:VOC family protein n=1 Tax=Nocardia sp. NBC_00403 TaxID=2975990 RepID=UPI002E1EE6D1
MSINTVTHINLRGNARAALEFYRSVFGGDLLAVTYADAGNIQHPDDADQVMWGQVASPDGFHIMAYDVPASMPWTQGENSYFVSARGESADEMVPYWERLSEGANIIRPLAPAGWAPLYGMLQDRFGVVWVLDVVAEYSLP